MEGIKDSRILLVEDEDSLAMGLKFNLERSGANVEWTADGREALETLASKDFDLLVLDLMLPHVDGFEIASNVRAENSKLPILMLTARTGAKSRIKGLEIGADDYLTKPFHLEEFLLRVDKMLAREKRYSVKQRPSKGLILGDKRINFDTLEVISSDAETLRLTDREARVLRYLVRNQGTIVSRKDLLQNVWKTDSNIETRTVDVFVARLRKYFEPDPKAPIYIKSVRGSGYLFENRDDPF